MTPAAPARSARSAPPSHCPPRGVIFDLDGVLADTEHLWDETWAAYAAEHDYSWGLDDTVAVMGMSSTEWSRHIADLVHEVGSARAVYTQCVDHVVAAIHEGRGPLLSGAADLVRAAAARVSVAVASSAARPVIDAVLAQDGLDELLTVTVSSEVVARGKPAPDVYAEAANRLGQDVRECGLAVEDSGNGIKAAKAAGLTVIAIPNRQFPPGPDALSLADFVVDDHADALTVLTGLLDGDPTTSVSGSASPARRARRA